jgi:type I restriction enzyme R subunit
MKLKKSLEDVREVYNIARLLGYTDALEKLDFKLISKLLNEVANRLQLLNLQNAISDINSKELLNVAIEDVIFDFTKIGEEELRMLANDLQETAHKTRQELANNWNQKDPEWVSLFEDFRKLLEKRKINEQDFTKENAIFVSQELQLIHNRIKELNRKNSVLASKFNGDRKYARIFKSQEESGIISNRMWLYDVLKAAKVNIDNKVSQNEAMLKNKTYFKGEVSPILIESFEVINQKIDAHVIRKLTELTSNEYFLEYAV